MLLKLLSKIIPVLLLAVSLIGIPFSIYQYTIGKLSITYIYLFCAAAVTIIAYLIFDRYILKKNTCENKQNTQPAVKQSKPQHEKTTTIRILDICFYLGLTGLLLYIFNCTERSILYLILLGVLAAFIITPVFLSEKKAVCNHALLKSIVLVLTASLSIFKIFWWTGRDTWTHAAWSIQVADSGAISTNILGSSYYSTPLLHIENAITQIIPGFDVRLAAIFSVTIPLLILFSLGVFIVTRDIFGNRFAIIAVLVADFIGIIPYWATWAQSTTLACLFFAILLVPLFKIILNKDTAKRPAWIFLFVLFSAALMLAHLYSSFIYILFLCGVILTYLIVDAGKKKQMPKVSRLPIIFSVIGVMILVAGYQILRNISMMLGVFSAGFSQLGSILAESADTPAAEVSVSAVQSEIIAAAQSASAADVSVSAAQSEIIAAAQSASAADVSVSAAQSGIISAPELLTNNAALSDPLQIAAMLNSCFTSVNPDGIYTIITTVLHLTLLMAPLLLGLLFAAKHYLAPLNQKKRRAILYLLIPGLMIFFLFAVTCFAYPPMTDRPQYYLPIFAGALLAGIIWHYVTGKGTRTHISGKSFVTILVVVFLVVSLGSVHTLVEKPGDWKLESTNGGHSIKEVTNLQTIAPFIPNSSSLYSDYESVKFATKLSSMSGTIKKDTLLKFIPEKTKQQYVLFRTVLLTEGTTDYIRTGSNELSNEWETLLINDQYPIILDSSEERIFDGGEILGYYVL